MKKLRLTREEVEIYASVPRDSLLAVIESDLAHDLLTAYDQIKRLEGALPKTADAVAVYPEMLVWSIVDGDIYSDRVWRVGGDNRIDVGEWSGDARLCYSTEEAARSALSNSRATLAQQLSGAVSGGKGNTDKSDNK